MGQGEGMDDALDATPWVPESRELDALETAAHDDLRLAAPYA